MKRNRFDKTIEAAKEAAKQYEQVLKEIETKKSVDFKIASQLKKEDVQKKKAERLAKLTNINSNIMSTKKIVAYTKSKPRPDRIEPGTDKTVKRNQKMKSIMEELNPKPIVTPEEEEVIIENFLNNVSKEMSQEEEQELRSKSKEEIQDLMENYQNKSMLRCARANKMYMATDFKTNLSLPARGFRDSIATKNKEEE